MIRIPAARGNKTRAEVRSVDVASNPYLACSVLLAAGLDGIKGNCSSHEPIRKNLFEQSSKDRDELGIKALPANLYEAIECFKNDNVIQEAVGEVMTEKFIEAKSLEWDEYRTQVTEWEIKKYLTKY
jgi:glutamine synthetase